MILGIIFGDDRLIGYSFIGVGIFLSVLDAFMNRKDNDLRSDCNVRMKRQTSQCSYIGGHC
jgi:hypothetical protein